MELARRLRVRMVDRLERVCAGAWREALLAVPRHAFVPDVIWHGTSKGYLPLCRTDDVDAWLGLAYADLPLVVQVDGGAPAGPLGRCATSTLLSPYDVLAALSTVDIQPGMRVCEIGTGTGYTAAVLAHRLGAENVTTVEVDAALAQDARRRLRSAGLGAVTVVHGDGAELAGGLFDRVLSSATVREVPYSWVRRVRPGGLVVTSWGTPYHAAALLRLTVCDDGSAGGRLGCQTHCEWLRAQRADATLAVAGCEAGLSRAGSTMLDIEDVGADHHACVAIGLRVPSCASVFIPPDDQWFVDPASGSWARLHIRSRGAPHIVNQYGPRDLWDEVEAAYDWWLASGRPSAGSWRFTVMPEGTTVEPAPAPV